MDREGHGTWRPQRVVCAGARPEPRRRPRHPDVRRGYGIVVPGQRVESPPHDAKVM